MPTNPTNATDAVQRVALLERMRVTGALARRDARFPHPDYDKICVKADDILWGDLRALLARLADVEAENTRLTQQVEEAKDHLGACGVNRDDYDLEWMANVVRQMVAEMQEQLGALLAENASLREAFRQYGDHDYDVCNGRLSPSKMSCPCGFADAYDRFFNARATEGTR